jgi:TAG lipase/steryl ester hydrolase/phospholipase A2/LPA acyltransferase
LKETVTFKFQDFYCQNIMSIDELMQQFFKVTEQVTQLGVKNIPYYAEKLIVEVWLRVLNSLYSPKQIFHNLAMVAAIQVLVGSIQFVNNVTHKMIMKFTTKGKLERILLDKLSSATSYCEWRAIATQLDELKGLNIWRSIDVSSLYDSSIVAKRISGTVDMLNNGDAFNLMFRLRGGLARDQFGVQHSGLFSRAMAGTKHIVERYHEAVASALCFICDTNDADVMLLSF